jgi:hypothetical protein
MREDAPLATSYDTSLSPSRLDDAMPGGFDWLPHPDTRADAPLVCMIPRIIPTVTRSIFNGLIRHYLRLRSWRPFSRAITLPLEGFFDVLDVQYLRFSWPDALGFPARLGYLIWTNPCL